MKASPASSSRDVVSVANNPNCQRLIRMRAMGLSDEQVHLLLTGQELNAEHRGRTAALRWGRWFDWHLANDGAAVLRTAIHGIAHFDPHTVRVLNVEDAARTSRGDPSKHAVLVTEQVLGNAARQHPSHDILLQPALKVSRAKWGTMIVRPDALVLDRARNWYWPLEAKAYPAMNGSIAPAERRAMRLQAAVQLVALQDAPEAPKPSWFEALLVVASPFGLTPEPAILEHLEAEVSLISQAIAAINAEYHNPQLHPVPGRHAALLRDATYHLQESCVVGCGLVNYCRAEHPSFHTVLGDVAQRTLPPPSGGPDYLDELRTSAPELHNAWGELAAILGLEGPYGAA